MNLQLTHQVEWHNSLHPLLIRLHLSNVIEFNEELCGLIWIFLHVVISVTETNTPFQLALHNIKFHVEFTFDVYRGIVVCHHLHCVNIQMALGLEEEDGCWQRTWAVCPKVIRKQACLEINTRPPNWLRKLLLPRCSSEDWLSTFGFNKPDYFSLLGIKIQTKSWVTEKMCEYLC